MRRMTDRHFLLVNKDKLEIVVPRDIGVEPQQRYHTGYDGSPADALYILTCQDWGEGADWPKVNEACGRWSGDRVEVVSSAVEAYNLLRYSCTNISEMVRNAFTDLFGIEYREVTVGDFSYWERVDF